MTTRSAAIEVITPDGTVSCQYTIHRRQVRNARIEIDPSCVITVVVPRRFREVDINSLIETKRRWIAKTVSRLRSIRRRAVVPAPGELLLFGVIHRWVHDPSLGRKSRIDESAGLVTTGRDLDDEASREAWYRETFRRYVTERARTLAGRHGFTFNRIQIRRQKTRWGSCSASGTLSFNWRLVMTPRWVIDNIVLHELLHTRIRSHGPIFWENLKRLDPRTVEARAWLRASPPP